MASCPIRFGPEGLSFSRHLSGRPARAPGDPRTLLVRSPRRPGLRGPATTPSRKTNTSTGTPSPSASLTTSSSSSLRAPRRENTPGEFYVDSTCIDCDTCRWMAPSVFSRAGSMSAVHRQPSSPEERLQTLQALLSCPTASIHSKSPPADVKLAHHSFPLHVAPDLPGVYHTGFHSEKSFGATSYYVQTPGCNVLVDSPRYTEVLAARLEAMGGVDYLFLTHRDDVADHEKWARRFGCKRVMHSGDVSARTSEIEVHLQGPGPWTLPLKEDSKAGHRPEDRPEGIPKDVQDDVPEDCELVIVHTPGHSPGSCCLLLAPREAEHGENGNPGSVGALFSGDHVALDEDDVSLTLFPEYCSMSMRVQGESARKLKGLPFLWLLPGHGRRVRFRDGEHREKALGALSV